jgi:hypothetical protein
MPKVITLKNPHAYLCCLGFKQFETRGFKTEHRGPLYIHSSMNMDWFNLCFEEPFKSCIREPHHMKHGRIIGMVHLVDCIPVEEVKGTLEASGRIGARELAFGDYSPGRYAWALTHPVLFKFPRQVRGALSLWDYPVVDETPA